MTLEADALIDRRRLKRGLVFWRIATVLALVAVLFLLLPRRIAGLGPHIERVRIAGLIGDGRMTVTRLDRLRRDPAVVAVLLHLDTPGGAVAGGEAIHDAVAALAGAKPVAVVMDGTAASAGYMIACAAPHIVARASTLTGSIGVILQTSNVGGLLAKLGVAIEPLVSGPLKDQPSLDKPLSPEGRQVLQGIVGDLYDQFVGIVASGRHMDAAAVRKLADGRAYTGRQALAVGLVDELGGEREARRWLVDKRHVAAELPVSEAARRRGWLARTLRSALQDIVPEAEEALLPSGAWAIWQPAAVVR